MAVNAKQVVFVDRVMSASFIEVMAAQPDIRLQLLDSKAPDALASPLLDIAHGYQISSARSELAETFRANAALLARMKNLLVVSTGGAGYDTIDVDACTAAGVLAVNQAGGNREAVAEHVLGFLLALTKRIGETDRFMRRQPDIAREQFMGHDVIGRTIGIIGLGHVGSRIAELCRGLFRMRVLACDPYLSDVEIGARGAKKVDLATLLAGSDYVSVNCPLTAETQGMLGAGQFAGMKRGAYYINAARGFIHDETALAAALASGQVAGAGLDVWDTEPPPPDHPLLQFDNVLASPHTAGVTFELRDNIARIGAEQMIAVLAGARPPRLLNPGVWPAYRVRFRAIMGREADQ